MIGTTPDRSPWLADCLRSLEGCRWPVHWFYTYRYELATITWAARRFDEFVFMPHSTEVLDQRVFDLCFEEHRGKSVNLGTAQGLPFRMYLGKYLGDVVQAMGTPDVRTKAEAVHHEVYWCGFYGFHEHQCHRLAHVGGPMEHTNNFVRRHGRINMLCENEYLRRYKATWDPAMVRDRQPWTKAV